MSKPALAAAPKTRLADRARQAWATLRGQSRDVVAKSSFNADFNDERHWRGVGSGYRLQLPGTSLDYEKLAGDVWDNSVAAICLGWVADSFLSAPGRVFRPAVGKGAEPRIVEPNGRSDRSFAGLMAYPNPEYSASTLWGAVAVSYKAAGSAYVLKYRQAGLYDTSTRVVELYWLPHFLVCPKRGEDGKLYYEYWANGVRYEIPRENVIHFRRGIDPRRPLEGMSPLRRCLRSIVSENEADTYGAAVLMNLGIVGGIVSPDGQEAEIREPEALKNKLRDATTGDNRGEIVLSPVGLKITPFSVTPEQMALDKIRQVPMATIAAACGVPLMVVGLPDPGKTYSNLGEAESQAWRNGNLPMMQIFANDLNEHREDLGARGGEYFAFDTSQVAALADDHKVKAETDKLNAEAAEILINIGGDGEATFERFGFGDITYTEPMAPETDPPNTTDTTEANADKGSDGKASKARRPIVPRAPLGGNRVEVKSFKDEYAERCRKRAAQYEAEGIEEPEDE